MYSIVYTKDAVKDIPKLKAAKLNNKAKFLIDLIKANPFQMPPSFEKLQGNLQGAFIRRINFKHRLVYSIAGEEQVVTIISMWSHCGFDT